MSEEKAASLGCAQCGSCCERIKITMNAPGFTGIVSTSGGVGVMRAYPWRGGFSRMSFAAGRYMRDATFIRRWMEPTGEVERVGSEVRQVWRCLKFDPVERLCTAHDERPEMCSGYPWYGREPGVGGMPHEKHCSYLLDLPPDQRPEEARPLIPLTVLSG